MTLEAGNILTLEDGGTVDLTAFLDNTDDHNITDFSLDNGTGILTLTLEDGGTETVDFTTVLAAAGTDDQTITDLNLTGTTLSVTIENGTTQSVSLNSLEESGEITAAIIASEALDLDKDETNEIQTLTSTDGSVTLTQTGDDYDLSVPAETVTTVANTIAGNKIADYTNENGTTVDIDETITTLTATAATDDLDYDYTNEDGTVTTFRSSPIVAFGKVSSTGSLVRGYGASVTKGTTGNYTINLSTARSTLNYTIQLTILDSNGAGNDDYDISYSNQATGSFVVQVGDNDNGGSNRAPRDFEFMFTVIDY